MTNICLNTRCGRLKRSLIFLKTALPQFFLTSTPLPSLVSFYLMIKTNDRHSKTIMPTVMMTIITSEMHYCGCFVFSFYLHHSKRRSRRIDKTGEPKTNKNLTKKKLLEHISTFSTLSRMMYYLEFVLYFSCHFLAFSLVTIYIIFERNSTYTYLSVNRDQMFNNFV